MKFKMDVSVIIPVYNAEKFVQFAVISALQQSQTAEVILVEDASTDNSLKICMDLYNKYDKVKLLHHPDKANKGAGASRNLGLTHAISDYIAFLDADDYYLPNRFDLAEAIFKMNSDIDGIYEAVGIHFYSETEKLKWLSDGGEMITCVYNPVSPDMLFESLASGANGYIHLDGLVFKRRLKGKYSCFFEQLRLHQDTAFILQLAARGILVHGSISTPVAVRGIHERNRITKNRKAKETVALFWETISNWATKENIRVSRKILIYRMHLASSYQFLNSPEDSSRFRKIAKFRMLLLKLLQHPLLFICSIGDLILKKILHSNRKYRVKNELT